MPLVYHNSRELSISNVYTYILAPYSKKTGVPLSYAVPTVYSYAAFFSGTSTIRTSVPRMAMAAATAFRMAETVASKGSMMPEA